MKLVRLSTHVLATLALSVGCACAGTPPPALFGYTNLTQLSNYVPQGGPFRNPEDARAYINDTFASYRFVFAVDPGSLFCKANVAPYEVQDFFEHYPPNNIGVTRGPSATPHELPQCDAVRPSDGYCIHASCLPAPANLVGTYDMYAYCQGNSRFRNGGGCDCAPETT